MEENSVYPLEVKEEATPPLPRAPEVVLQEAQRAALALQRVVAGKKKPVIFKGEQYLEFEDWQTVGKFYGLCARTFEATPVEIFGVKGAKARAEVVDLRTGQVVGGAEAYCMRDEENWAAKPWFQLASMAQTRAGAKALRNVLAWVVVLAGYRPTPAEELPPSPAPAVKAKVIAPQGNPGGSAGLSEKSAPGYSQSGQSAPGYSPVQDAPLRQSNYSTVQGAPAEKSAPTTTQGASPTPSNVERPTREEIQNLLRLALKNGFQTVNAEGKKCVDYHHLGAFLKENGLPPMVRDLTREECRIASLSLEARAKTLFSQGERDESA